ncbi:hypothetical protein SSX86_009259 [Deinandra increscens subsp. villosa]|uniref:Exostosin GT47 domain-containing protein n=1 Tax=Deinandra increscens subsp. villosa TaxID=3103831 RepID=A0AAP0H4Q7_9ASTR
MGNETRYLLEIKKFVWLVAVVFAMFMIFQYFEFPYGDVVSSLFSVHKGQIAGETTHFHLHNNNNTSDASSPISVTFLPPNSPALTLPTTVNTTLSNPTIPLGPDTSKPGGDASKSVKNFNELPKNPVNSDNKSPAKDDARMGDVVTLSQMHDILVHNRASSRSMKPRWSSAVDQELQDAKFQIENANVNEDDLTLYPSLYVNVSRFKRSYELMEKILRVYIYKEGEKPIFHQPQAVLKGIYASEGWFMKNMKASQHFVTKEPKQAHLFYIPFSSRMLEEKLYVPDSQSQENLVQYLKSYLDLISGKYNFWNRTGGSDHFFVACHDWTPYITKKYMGSCIRAMCNSDVKNEGFNLGKDVSLPETAVRSDKNPLKQLGGQPASQRTTLAFFAGRMHGDVRPILLQHWGNKDPDMKIFGKLPKSKNINYYVQYMKTSKYCICAKGYEVSSPRVVEAIFYECVPVIISDNFVPPFFEVLNWESFAVFVKEKDIPNLKNILVSISETRYLVMQERVKKVQQHFLWHVEPIKYDIFHMILHSIWYNRVFRINPTPIRFLWLRYTSGRKLRQISFQIVQPCFLLCYRGSRSLNFNHHLFNCIFPMGHEIQYLLETKRFAWLVAVVFAMFMMFQYFEFPYGDVVSSLFSVHKGQIAGNTTHFHASNTSNISNLHNNNISDVSSPISATFLPPNSPALTLPTAVNSTLSNPTIPLGPNTSNPGQDASKSVKDFTVLPKNPVHSDNKSSAKEVVLMGDVVTLSQMHDILVHNRASSRSMKARWPSAADQELRDAKFQIENAHVNEDDPVLYPSLYVNVSRFKRSYELMEKILKVYIYKEGEKPIFHQPQAVLKGIYASEGWFMKNMKASQHFVTKKPKQAHLFYIPFSSRMLEEKLYVPDSHSHKNLVKYLKSYLDLIAGKYNFWNRTGGSDHFFVACHDWTPSITKKIMGSCIRAMCNSDVKNEGFNLGKDVSLPETTIKSVKNPLKEFGGKPASQRTTLAFFAGRMHGDVRPILLQHWENKDPDMKIFGMLPKSKNNKNYVQYMKSSKYCICAKGYEVNSPRVVEAIFYECVPVIISDNFVPPFFEVLNWESFAVFVKEKDIPNLKNILVSISETRYLVMQERVKKVQQHFLWHVKPIKYDIFHMILHSIWYNRVFRINPN